MSLVLLAGIYLLCTLDLMRSYFIRVPEWAKKIYPKADWNAPANEIVWTFDDGPHPESTPKLLELLDQSNVKATFFMTGKSCLLYPSLVDEVRQAGHRIGAHGFNHVDGWRTSTPNYMNDVIKSLEVLKTNLFRPAYGRMRLSQYHKVAELCDIMMWSVMPGDFEKQLSLEDLGKRTKLIKEKDIVVLHDTPFAVKQLTLLLETESALFPKAF